MAVRQAPACCYVEEIDSMNVVRVIVQEKKLES